MRKRIDFYCPNCKNKKRITINNEYDKSHINDILSKDIFKVKCEECNTITVLDYNFVLKTSKYVISYGKSKDVDRYCTSIDDFREKVLIFEDELNDIVIEMLKKKLNHDLNKDYQYRYDGSTNDQLVFYSLDSEESFGINKELYNYYLNKYNIEDVKNEEITDLNFYKYVK